MAHRYEILTRLLRLAIVLGCLVQLKDAAPDPTKTVPDMGELAVVRQVGMMKRLTTTDASKVGNLTRQHDGDVFDAYGKS